MTGFSATRAAVRLAAIGGLILALAPVQAALVRFAPFRADRLARWFHRRAGALLGLDVRVVGYPCARRPTLFVANHVSYLDVVAMGAALETCFVAKREVAHWPGVGMLARLQRSVFVARRRDALGDQIAAMRDRLAAGDNLVLFAEGTSSDGSKVLDFKSALFAVADASPRGPEPLVQPVWIAYRALDGAPLDAAARAHVAWYGDMTLAPHFLGLAGRRRVAVELGFAPPVAASAFAGRKELAAHCRRQVAAGLASALSGPIWWQETGAVLAPEADLTPPGPVLSL